MIESHFLNKKTLDSGVAILTLGTILVYGLALTQKVFVGDLALVRTFVLMVIILGSFPLFLRIVKNILLKHFAVDIIALLALISTVLLGEWLAALIILLMVSGGAYLEDYAEGRAKSALKKLLDTAPSIAHAQEGEEVRDIPIHDIREGTILLIKPHEVVPVDGVVVSGTTTLDESTLTGEPLPREVTMHDRVRGGTLNLSAVCLIRAQSDYAHSSFAKLLQLVTEAEKNKAPLVRLADRYSIGFTLFTLGMAAVAYSIDPPLAAAVLVVATPCPLLLAAPIAFIAGMSRSAKEGIIVKHGGVFEVLTRVNTFFFDKTGTITEGAPTLETVFVEKKGLLKRDILILAASLSQYGTHILAGGLIREAKKEALPLLPISSMQEVLGKGITGTLHNKSYILGSLQFLKEHTVEIPAHSEALEKTIRKSGNTLIHLAEGTNFLGSISFSDKLRSASSTVLRDVQKMNPESSLVLLTGDNEIRAEEIARGLPFKEIHANCLPENKVTVVTSATTKGAVTAMVGDGVNDSPALKSASVGIALGTHGETASTDAADAVISSDDLHKLPRLLLISHKTVRIAKESMLVGIGLSVALMFLAIMGGVPPLYGAILQETIDVVVIFNALRALV